MSESTPFDFKKCWLSLTPDERDGFAEEAGTTSHYIQTHLTGRRKMPGKNLMNQIFIACKRRKWVTEKTELLAFFYAR